MMDSPRLPLLLPADLRRCLFIRALEEGDPAGERIVLQERVAASHAAGGLDGLDFVRARADFLGARLKGPLLVAFEGISKCREGLPVWLGPSLGGAAFLLGWITHDLGKAGIVSLVAFPLLGLILWNLAVVLASLLGMRRPHKALLPAVLPSWLQHPEATSGDVFIDGVVSRTQREWQQAQTLDWLARLKRLFHVAALLLAAGVVAGMYARGLVKQYQAGWESTFLTQPVVAKLTGIVLGPASIVTGVAIPSVPPQGGLSPAAPWIHLWAATAGLFILLPRLLLISITSKQASRSKADWAESFAGYAAQARRLADGQPLVAKVLPVQCDPDSRLRDGLRAVLQHLWGGQVMIDFLPGVAYGEEDECLAVLAEPPTHLVLLIPLAVTPEDEVHGTLQRGLEKVMARAVRPPFALTVLDAATFEKKLSGMPEAGRRMAERHAAWEKIMGTAWPLLVLDSSARRDPAAAVAAVTAARQPLQLWTAGA